MEKVVAEAEELPKAIVRRVVKDKLSQCYKGDGDLTVHKEAVLAFSESARIFIHYLSATANDICKEKRRQTISGDDVLKAVEEIEFPEFLKPLKASLEELRQKNPGKNAGKSPQKNGGKSAGKKAATPKAKDAKKKRKLEGPSSSRKQKEKVVEDDEDEQDGSDEE